MRTDKDDRKLLSMLPHGNNLFPVCAHAAIHIENEDDLKNMLHIRRSDRDWEG